MIKSAEQLEPGTVMAGSLVRYRWQASGRVLVTLADGSTVMRRPTALVEVAG